MVSKALNRFLWPLSSQLLLSLLLLLTFSAVLRAASATITVTLDPANSATVPASGGSPVPAPYYKQTMAFRADCISVAPSLARFATVRLAITRRRPLLDRGRSADVQIFELDATQPLPDSGLNWGFDSDPLDGHSSGRVFSPETEKTVVHGFHNELPRVRLLLLVTAYGIRSPEELTIEVTPDRGDATITSPVAPQHESGHLRTVTSVRFPDCVLCTVADTQYGGRWFRPLRSRLDFSVSAPTNAVRLFTHRRGWRARTPEQLPEPVHVTFHEASGALLGELGDGAPTTAVVTFYDSWRDGPHTHPVSSMPQFRGVSCEFPYHPGNWEMNFLAVLDDGIARFDSHYATHMNSVASSVINDGSCSGPCCAYSTLGDDTPPWLASLGVMLALALMLRTRERKLAARARPTTSIGE